MVGIKRMGTRHPISQPSPQHDRAMLLSPCGTAALAVVRVEGPGAPAWIACHFGSVPGLIARHGRWRMDPDDLDSFLDDPLILETAGGYEIHLHGGVRIVERLLHQAAAAGFEVLRGDAAVAAAAGDELEAALPYVGTETGLRMLLAQPEAWKALDPETADVEILLADRTLERMIRPATVALVGAANVGKSTLANFLFREERSIVGDRPGTTRDWVGHLVELNGLPVTLIDTPGRRLTEDEIEQQAIRQSAGPVEQADVVVLMVDATRPQDVPPGLAGALRVANKCDLAEAPEGCLPICAATGKGVEALIEAIHRRLGVDVNESHRIRIWTVRQRRLIEMNGRKALHTLRQQLILAQPHGVPQENAGKNETPDRRESSQQSTTEGRTEG